MFRVGTAGVDWVFVGLGVGKPVVVTDRVSILLVGVAFEELEEVGRDSGASGISERAFRVFGIGSAGRGAVGGLDRGGRGRKGL